METAHPASRPGPTDADLIARHLGPDGRLVAMPAKPSRRLIVLRHIAADLPADQDLDEFAVNQVLRRYDDDVAMLRRYLVDTGLVLRPAPGCYRRPRDHA
ncbi:MAG TPA: DUF2087 domain-containing protein [Microlunatus sp.]|nr:DUF2087 domain-containing protein [Microlunatus sp.]